ncbi:hypothetical protein GH714_013193 [Hevea brasiliensis]|uniref:Uncharacterized protein n=1 Tax=Hevea brasiliensis TaxID=3981 RepID=A0A6A6M852_HEVBR|nr:hypothetical protein GH714_013193 [Hevea brasiliensis]
MYFAKGSYKNGNNCKFVHGGFNGDRISKEGGGVFYWGGGSFHYQGGDVDYLDDVDKDKISDSDVLEMMKWNEQGVIHSYIEAVEGVVSKGENDHGVDYEDKSRGRDSESNDDVDYDLVGDEAATGDHEIFSNFMTKDSEF